MPRHIKTAALAGSQDEADARTRATVDGIIADVRARGDAAVRELSEKLRQMVAGEFSAGGQRGPRAGRPGRADRGRRHR